MKGSGWTAGAVVIQIFWMLAFMAPPVYRLLLARCSRILNGPDGREAAYGLRAGTAVLAVPAVFAIASTYALGKEKLRGWWTALLSNTAMLGILLDSMTDEDTIDCGMIAITLVSAAMPLLLRLPGMRKFYWRVTEPRLRPYRLPELNL